MIRTLRAAAFAVAAFTLAATAMWSGPLQAWQGDAPTATPYYLDHAAASSEVSDFGLNGDETGNAAATVVPAPVAPVLTTAPDAEESARIGALAERLIDLANGPFAQQRSLSELIANYAGGDVADPELDCLANAVYFEARGEPVEGQLAVAEVVLNRTRSGRYPPTICAVVTQPWQFSFVRRGVIPSADRNCEAWRRAVAIARIAEAGASRLLPDNVLWYHAEYVSPSWGRRLARNTKIGLHIFYS